MSNKLKFNVFSVLLSQIHEAYWLRTTQGKSYKLKLIFWTVQVFISYRCGIICAILTFGVNKLQLIIKCQLSYWKTAQSQKRLASYGCDTLEARAQIPTVCESHLTVNSVMTVQQQQITRATLRMLRSAGGPVTNLTAVLSLNVRDQTRVHLPGREKKSSAKAAKNLDLST